MFSASEGYLIETQAITTGPATKATRTEMAKVKSEQVDDGATSTGSLQMPDEADSTANSIAAGIMADLAEGEEIAKPKRTRTHKAKTVMEALAGDDDAALEAIDEPEPEAEPDDEPQAEPEAKDGDDETDEPTELDDQLLALAQNHGVDPELLEGAESVAEAERFINKMYSVFYREGAAQNGHATNGHAEHQQVIPAAPAVQTKAADALEIDLSKYDDDEPIKADLQRLIDRDKAREQRLAALESEKTRTEEANFRRVQQDVAYQFQNEFFTQAPELFGTAKKQDPRQAQKMRKVFEVADTFIRGYAASGKPMPAVAAIAKWAVNAEFADELNNQKNLAKRVTVQEREKRRSVGGPARVGRNAINPSTSARVHEGDMKDDPDLLAAVKMSLNKSRA